MKGDNRWKLQCLWITNILCVSHLKQQCRLRLVCISISSYLYSRNLWKTSLFICLVFQFSIQQPDQFCDICFIKFFSFFSFFCALVQFSFPVQTLLLFSACIISNRSEVQNTVLIYVVGQLSGSLGLCDETVKEFEIFKHESGAENRSGESNKKGFL